MCIIGAILGDIIGQPYEFMPLRSDKERFELIRERNLFTDDTVMTIAVADALLRLPSHLFTKPFFVHKTVINSMKRWGRLYRNASYGPDFYNWIASYKSKPYGSYGNGSAMRVSSVGFIADSLDMCSRLAKMTAEVTHNHPEGIKGAQAVADAIWIAHSLRGEDIRECKEQIRGYISAVYHYDLSRTCDDIRNNYEFDVSCQGSVPESIIAFLDSSDYEDAVRNAVSLGGDADTMACIAGSIAEACYGIKSIPQGLVEKGLAKLPEDMLNVISRFYSKYEKYDIHL